MKFGKILNTDSDMEWWSISNIFRLAIKKLMKAGNKKNLGRMIMDICNTRKV